MKKVIYLLPIFMFVSLFTTAQTQKGWYLIGGNLSNMSLNFQKGKTAFSFNIEPKVAWFVKDNLAIGGQVLAGINTSNGYTAFNYGIGPLVRFYTANKTTDMKKSRIFIESNVGIFGQNVKVTGSPSTNTNGLGVGIGPGYSYFLNQNVAIEGLLKYNLNVGFGNSTTNNSLSLGIGFQIYLPGSKVRSEVNKI
ncbi:MAG: hypothetical protein ABIP68_04285 [Ferruginibacter sp.]